MQTDEISAAIMDFVTDELVDDDTGIDADTRLFEQGLVDSMNLVRLLGFLESSFEVRIPVSMVNDKHFATISSICCTLAGETRAPSRIELQRSDFGSGAVYRRSFHAPVLFSAPQNAMHFGREAAEAEEPAPRLVVFGDADFASNDLIETSANRDLFVNSVNWLMGDVEAISIRPRLSRASRFNLSAQDALRIRLLSLFVLPEAIAVIGVFVWWSRRSGTG